MLNGEDSKLFATANERGLDDITAGTEFDGKAAQKGGEVLRHHEGGGGKGDHRRSGGHVRPEGKKPP